MGEAIWYSLSAPGKRLRPALVLAGCQALGGPSDASELGTAVEVIHTYSLVHDDLPCMDDDDLRRGRLTTHRQFDVATATEAGFRMVPLAGRMLVAGAHRLGLAPATTRAIVRELFRAAGATGMIGGQVLDLEAEGREVTRDELVRIHRAKTGALITASVVVGGLAAGGAAGRVDALRRYGEDVGMAFQIIDDVLDATATSSELGKTAGKDARQRKATFASVLGVETARTEAHAAVERAVAHLGAAGVDSTLLSDLAQFIVHRRS